MNIEAFYNYVISTLGRKIDYSEFVELNPSISAKKDGVSFSNGLVCNTKKFIKAHTFVKQKKVCFL
jgi:hypothetical protein